MRLSPGATLGPYEILAHIGSGAMGEVYRARDTRLERLVAIKVSDEQFSGRFQREAHAVAALNHPNICHLYDIGPNYLVMELVDGGPVRAPDDPQSVLDVGVQIADGLIAAHQAGIVHRDLKPVNILMTRDRRVKILDFGLATLESASGRAVAAQTMAATDPGTTVGTAAYMSPEQARGESVDARSDLWSLGVVLYELATRVRPFEGATTAVLFDGILNKAPIPVRDRNPKVPPPLAQAIEKLLEKDRTLRYQSAADLRADLRRVERDSSSPSVVAPVARPVSTWRRRAGPAVAAAIIVGLATGAFFWRRAQATPLTERDVVVLSEFSNTTGEPVFDSTLRAALSIQLEQSPFLKIMGDDQMREGLRLMDRPANERITADVAREICVRMNEKATIGGAIDKLGAAYAVTLQAVHCQNGEALAREQVQAADKEHVLEAVSTAARALRARLGESLASIEKLSLPLNQVTTSSLEALQAFAIGSANLNGGDPLAAVKQLERATSLDQNFAMAWWVLASAYQNAGVGVQGAAIDKAFALRDRLSERERLAIETGYYAQRTGEWDKAADAAELGTKTYPREALPHFVLVGLRTFAGRPDDALHENLEAVRLDPRNAVFTAGLVGVYARLDRFDEAKAVAVKALADPKLDVPVLHLNLLRIAYIQRDEPAVDRELKWFNGNSQDYNAMVAQAANALRLGQRRHAAQLLQQAGETAKRRGVPFGGALVNPLDDALIGNCPPPIGPGMPELVLALCGDPEAALAAADTTSGRTKANGWHMVQLPMVRAAVAMRRKQPEQAIEALKLAVRHDLYQPLLPYLRGQAYLDANRANEAAAEFRKVIDHQGIHWRFNQALPRDTGPLAPVAQVGLARSLALAGDTAGARKAYQDFLALWKDADPDIPILIQAKKDYAALE